MGFVRIKGTLRSGFTLKKNLVSSQLLKLLYLFILHLSRYNRLPLRWSRTYATEFMANLAIPNLIIEYNLLIILLFYQYKILRGKFEKLEKHILSFFNLSFSPHHFPPPLQHLHCPFFLSFFLSFFSSYSPTLRHLFSDQHTLFLSFFLLRP